MGSVGLRALCALFLAVSASAVAADPVEDFYKDRQINLVLGFSPGGGFDAYARLVTRTMPKYIPGEPRFITRNMPGAGSMIAANHVYNVSPKDGSVNPDEGFAMEWENYADKAKQLKIELPAADVDKAYEDAKKNIAPSAYEEELKKRNITAADMREDLRRMKNGRYSAEGFLDDDGIGDDPVKIQANVEAMEEMSLKVFRRGHLPVMGEWFALPLLKKAGSKKLGDAIFDEIFHPIARELIGKCDAVLRIGGASSGADDMVATGRRLGKKIFLSLEEIPERPRG